MQLAIDCIHSRSQTRIGRRADQLKIRPSTNAKFAKPLGVSLAILANDGPDANHSVGITYLSPPHDSARHVPFS
jgi:hypothetical protein